MQLRKALLGLDDLPPGFESVHGDSGESGESGESGKASSPRAQCAPLVKLLNAAATPGSVASAGVSFTGGPDGPDLDESLDAVKQAATAVSNVAGYRTAVAACESVTYSIPGAGSSTLHARRISFDPIGDASFAARFSATSGALDGFDVIQVEVADHDVVVGLSFYSMDPTDAADATTAALDKAQGVLGTSNSSS